MEAHDFKFDHFKWIDHEDFPDIINKIRARFKGAGILEMLLELDHMETDPNENKHIQDTKLATIKRLIAIKLDLFDNAHGGFLIDTLPGYVEANEAEIKKVKKTHKTHRHDKDKSFSSVPI